MLRWKPGPAETVRSAVLGVFLCVEYFQGVLFPTTNRKQDFGRAFKSPIPLTSIYPDLSEAAYSAIGRRFITSVQMERVASGSDDVLDSLGVLALNV